MNKEETVQLMLQSFEDDNMTFCLQAGMEESEAKDKISESRPTMKYFFSNIYDILLEKNIIKSE
jgi:hypothetical protein